MTTRFRIRLELEVDRDMVPGWGHQVEDFVALVQQQFPVSSPYNPVVRVLSTEEVTMR